MPEIGIPPWLPSSGDEVYLPSLFIDVGDLVNDPGTAGDLVLHPATAPVVQVEVTPAAPLRRPDDLRALADAKAASYRAARAGGRADVVLLRRSGGWHEGLTGDYLPVRLATSQAVGTRLTASLRLVADGTLQAVPVEPAA